MLRYNLVQGRIHTCTNQHRRSVFTVNAPWTHARKCIPASPPYPAACLPMHPAVHRCASCTCTHTHASVVVAWSCVEFFPFYAFSPACFDFWGRRLTRAGGGSVWRICQTSTEVKLHLEGRQNRRVCVDLRVVKSPSIQQASEPESNRWGSKRSRRLKLNLDVQSCGKLTSLTNFGAAQARVSLKRPCNGRPAQNELGF